jgi:hypothetical protein
VSEESACRGRSIEAARRREAGTESLASARTPRKWPQAGMPVAPALAELQALFQSAVIDGDDAVLDLVADSSRTTRDVLFGVYLHAYRARLVEILRNDYAELACVTGDRLFEELAFAYIAEHPSRTQNARWFGNAFPEHVASHPSAASSPELSEIACFTRALNDAFDAADGTRLTISDLAGVPPAMWGGLVFTPHPAVRRVDLCTNAVALWKWAGEDAHELGPPAAVRLDDIDRIAVYRPELTPRYRRLAYEEAMMFDEMAKGVPFAGLCEMVSTRGGEADAALRAATHLKVWIEEGMLSGPEPT